MPVLQLFISLFFAFSSVEQPSVKIPLETKTLKNGLTVIMSENHRVPTVGVALLYKVGSRDETSNEYGFAHLFEHMMFQGSEHVGKMEHFDLITGVGGRLNAFTWKDFTLYFETVPQNNLALALWLEADRMNSLAVNQKNLKNQKDTVIEEMKQNVDNRSYGTAPITLGRLAYKNKMYGHPVYGSKKNIRNSTLKMVRQFHDRFYKPNNAILVIAGDFNKKHAFELVKKYFSIIESGDKVEQKAIIEPKQLKFREKTIKDKKANLPALFMAWHIPNVSSSDYYALDVLSRVLFDGKSSRLYEKLVHTTQLAVSVSGGVEGKTGPDIMTASVILSKPEFSDVIDLIEDEFTTIANQGITQKEINKVLKNVKSEFFEQFSSNLTLAKQIAFYTYLFDNPESINQEIDKYKKVTIQDVKRVAAKYGIRSNLSVVKVEPK